MRTLTCFLVVVVLVAACYGDNNADPQRLCQLPTCSCPIDEPCNFREGPSAPPTDDCVDVYCFNGQWHDVGTCPDGWDYPNATTIDPPYNSWTNCPCGPPVYFGGILLGETNCCKQGCPQSSFDAGDGDAGDGDAADVSVDTASD